MRKSRVGPGHTPVYVLAGAIDQDAATSWGAQHCVAKLSPTCQVILRGPTAQTFTPQILGTGPSSQPASSSCAMLAHRLDEQVRLFVRPFPQVSAKRRITRYEISGKLVKRFQHIVLSIDTEEWHGKVQESRHELQVLHQNSWLPRLRDAASANRNSDFPTPTFVATTQPNYSATGTEN